MALSPKLSNLAANAGVDAIAALLDGGTMEIRTGSQPATVDDPETGTLLATLTFGTPAFGAGVAGVATANALTGEADAPNTGSAGYYRCKTSGGAAIEDGSVGTSDANCILSQLLIVQHATVNINSFVLRQRKS